MVWLTDAAVIRLGGGSNTRSVGVTQGETPMRALSEVESDVREAKRLGARTVVLVGGEPLVRKDVPKVLSTVLQHSLTPALVTNGRMLVYEKLRQLLVRAHVGYLRVELHGPAAAVHDAIVGVSGAFDQTREGLRSLLLEGPVGLRVDVACTVLATNLEHLDAWVEMVTALPRKSPLCLRLVAPIAVPEPALWPDAESVSRHVGAALMRIQRAGADLVAAWEGFPPCLLEEHGHLRDEVVRCGAPVLGARGGGASLPIESPKERSHPFPCQDCVHEPTCPGAPKGFLANDGEVALRPTRRVRANSFNFEFVRTIPSFNLEPGACTARSLDLSQGTIRSLFVVREEGVSLYESPTADFTDHEVAAVKDELEQIYVDLNEGAALNDFVTHVRRARFDEGCRGCPDRKSCCGAVRIDSEPPFEREERWLKKEVSRLRGRVLDVGCGDQMYHEEMAELIVNGDIEYHGLDPDEAALDRIRARGHGGTLYHGEIESFSFDLGYFDYVLVFRSLNHFRDMTEAFRVISRVMRVQGQIVLCDSPPFAMLRTPEQVSFADENAPVGHEHYRNWTSHQVVEFLKRYPFRVDVHRPVSAKTSNQWILKLMRVPDGADGQPDGRGS